MTRKARNEEIEVKVDLSNPQGCIWYKRLNDHDTGWISSPFERHHVRTESEALMLVDSWLNRGDL